MENKTDRQTVANIGLASFLIAIILVGCSSVDTPPTAVPVATELTASPTPLAVATTTASPSLTPTRRTASPTPTQLTGTPTPIAATLTPDAYARHGDTISPHSSQTTPTPTASLSPPSPSSTPLPVVAAPTTAPDPAASPTLPAAPSLTSWRGEYYDNPGLAGEPVLVRDDPALDFNWGSANPGPNIPADYFSARWTRAFEFAEEGDYRFLADVDDGVKLYLDGWLIIDEWNTNPYVLHSGAFADIKPGVHTLIVEYFEEAGDAHAKVWFEKTLLSADKWVGEYYNNPDFRDAPFLVREDDDLDFDWDDDEPVSGMNDDFSVRWQKTVTLKEGDYEFEANLAEKDRVWIYLDNWLIIDRGSNDGGTVSGTFDDVGAGAHTIKVEYQDQGGEARIEVEWDRDD